MSNMYVENLQTGRLIKKTTAKAKKLVKLGLIVLPPEPEVQKVEPTPEPEPEPTPVSLKTEIAKTAVTIVERNKDAFRDLSQEDTSLLLRKLLIDKLCLKKESKKPKKPEKFKLKPPPSSSESSDSD